MVTLDHPVYKVLVGEIVRGYQSPRYASSANYRSVKL